MNENEMENQNVENGNEHVDVPAEQAAEQVSEPVKTYTQDEVDAIVGKRLARQEAKLRREHDRENAQQNELIEILKAGTNQQTVTELKDSFRKLYASKGIPVPENAYSRKDIEILADAEAKEFIDAGYDDVVEEVKRLAGIGLENMTQRDKVVFKTLDDYRKNEDRNRELTKLGVSPDVVASRDFKDFAAKFNDNTPISEVYDIYRSRTPRKEIHTLGSMKNTSSGDSGVKDFYTMDEARRFTKKDYDENPALFAAVEKSMLKW